MLNVLRIGVVPPRIDSTLLLLHRLHLVRHECTVIAIVIIVIVAIEIVEIVIEIVGDTHCHDVGGSRRDLAPFGRECR